MSAPDCYCGIAETFAGVKSIAYCPLHAAAAEMYEALEEHLRLWNPNQDMPDFGAAIDQATLAVRHARGEP